MRILPIMRSHSFQGYFFTGSRLILAASFVFCALFVSLNATASDDVYIPEDLEDWKEWVLHDHRDLDCPHLATGKQRTPCAWVSQVEIDVSRTAENLGATFLLRVTAFAEADITLPYAIGVRAHDVRLNDVAAVVGGGSSNPLIAVDEGDHVVTGKLSWTQEPASLTIPESAGIVSLSIDGHQVPIPRYEPPKLWFTPQIESGQAEVVEVKVFRRLVDSIPQTLDTYVHLSVGGADRIIDLGQALPELFEFTDLSSTIPARVDRQGNVTVQATRGTHQLKISARALRDLTEFQGTKTCDTWPAEELWGFEARPNHRVVSIEGVSSVDLSLTTAPFEDVPGFLVSPPNVLELVEQQVTDVAASDGLFEVNRELWLGFDGEHFIAQDRLVADLDKERRISTHYIPGKIEDKHRIRLITYFDDEGDPHPGINASDSVEELTATTLIPRDDALFVTGWAVDVQELSATLHLPPGWRLLWTQGVDYARDSWLEQWDLWDIFLVLLLIAISLQVTRSWWVALLGIAAIITYHDSAAPTIGWIVLVAIRAIQDRIPAQKVQFVLKGAYWIVFGIVAVVSLYFSITHVRQAIYPQLEERETFSLETYFSSEATSETQEMVVGSSVIRRNNFDLPSPKGVSVPAVYSEDSIRQTGPGTPTWDWDSAELTWYGPVKQDQQMSLILMPPWLSRIVDAAAGILVLILAMYFLGSTQLKNLPLGKLQRFLPALLLIAFVPDINADTPDPRILDELETRLTDVPDCLPNCASTESVEVILDKNDARIISRIHSLDTFAVPLPTISVPTADLSVSLEGEQIPTTRTSGGVISALLSEGISSLTMTGSIGAANAFDIEFPMKPARVVLVADGWRVSGIADGVLTGKNIQLSRIAIETKEATQELIQERAIPYVRVTRNIYFSLETHVDTTVQRLAPVEGAFRVQLPLLPGEEVLETSGTVEDETITIDFANDQDDVVWISRMDTPISLALQAPDLSERVEVWVVSGSDHWHWDHTGLSPVSSRSQGAQFLPRSGDSLKLDLQKPLPAPGESSTVESVAASYSIGTRLLTGNLLLKINATQGSELQVELPEGATVREIMVGLGRSATEYPPPDGHVVTLPISPGEKAYRISWELERSLSFMFRSPEVKLQTPARNIDVQVEFQGNRWTVFLAGPLMGPAVLFWGVVIVILVIAIGLSLLPNFPLTRTDAVILSLGATLSNVWVLLLVGGWFVAIWVRGKNEQRLLELEEPYFQGIQVLLATLSSIALIALVITIPQALLGSPDMQIVGNDSTSNVFRWYTDQINDYLPQVTVFSLPNWIYLLLMLAWSLWLAFAIIKWSIATWNAMNKPYLWTKGATSPQSSEGKEPSNQDED